MLASETNTNDFNLFTKKNDFITIFNKLKNNSANQKPKLISVGTQSPKFTSDASHQTKQLIKQISNYSTPASITETKSPSMFFETPKIKNIKSNNENFVSQTPPQNAISTTIATSIDKNNLTNISDKNITPILPKSTSQKLFDSQTTNLQPSEIQTKNTLFEFKPEAIKTTSTTRPTTPTVDVISTTEEEIIDSSVKSSPKFIFKPSNTVCTIETATIITQSITTPISSTATKTLVNNTPASLNFSFKPTTSIVSNVINSNSTSNVMQSSLFTNNFNVSNNTNTNSKVNFTFKLPTDIQLKSSIQNDVGMDDDIETNVSTNSITFEFNT